MKTNKLSVLLLACCVILSGCRKQAQTITTEDTASPSTVYTETVATTEATEITVMEEQLPTGNTLETESVETSRDAETEPSNRQQTTKPTTAPTTPKKPTKPTVSTIPTKPVEPTNPTVPEKPTKPTTPATPTTPVAPAEPTETKPVTTEPTEPETKPTTPETKPTTPETKPTEPTGCCHDWKTIHHKEKGHWQPGIVCDCGWTVYGKASELVPKWNAHSASYPAEEALFQHGGYGSVDEWIVDKPAYDERVCRHCGEPKP